MTTGARKAASAMISMLVLVILVGSLLKAPTRQHRARSTSSVPSPAPSLASNEAETAPLRASIPSHTGREIDAQDSYNHTRSLAEYWHRQQLQRPAYQHLPYRNSEVSIQITNVTSDGRLVLDVAPLGLNVNPRTAYTSFLARYHDSGRAYLAEYGRYQQ